jgi:hypothetical protein
MLGYAVEHRGPGLGMIEKAGREGGAAREEEKLKRSDEHGDF